MHGPCIDREDFKKGIEKYPCCQFYLGSSTSTKWKKIKHWDYKEGFRYYIHCPLNLNLAKESNTWHSEILGKVYREIKATPGSAVLHIGTLGTLERVATRLNDLPCPPTLNPRTLLLENSAGQGSSLGRSYKELRKLFEMIDYKNKIGLCIDTQHSFAAGLSTFSSHESVVKFWDKINSIAKIPMIHLNDSQVEFKTGKDRHAPLAEGWIWKDDLSGLETLLQLAIENDVDLISETGNYLQDREVLGLQ